MSDIQRLTHILAEERKALSWSQRELASKLKMKQSQISDIEAGKRDVRVSTIVELARCLGLELILVPRRLLPAVTYLLQSGESTSSQREEQTSMYETWKEED